MRTSDPTVRDLITRGAITVKGRLPWSSNFTFLVEVALDDTRTRAVLNQVLSATAMRPLRGHFTALAEAKVDELLARGRFDAICDLAEAYPLSVFPDALGLKQQGRDNLLPYASLVFNAFGPPNQVFQKFDCGRGLGFGLVHRGSMVQETGCSNPVHSVRTVKIGQGEPGMAHAFHRRQNQNKPLRHVLVMTSPRRDHTTPRELCRNI